MYTYMYTSQYTANTCMSTACTMHIHVHVHVQLEKASLVESGNDLNWAFQGKLWAGHSEASSGPATENHYATAQYSIDTTEPHTLISLLYKQHSYMLERKHSTKFNPQQRSKQSQACTCIYLPWVCCVALPCLFV